MVYRSFEELEVWRRACQMAIQIYEARRESRDDSLRDQRQPAAVSISTNIAEGAERGGKDLTRYLRVARGSAAELGTQGYIAARVGLLDADQMNRFVWLLEGRVRRLRGLLNGLVNHP